jgi:hypothetical protein
MNPALIETIAIIGKASTPIAAICRTAAPQRPRLPAMGRTRGTASKPDQNWIVNWPA